MSLKLPHDYIQLPGSQRTLAKDAKLLGLADASDTFQITIVLRRRTDGPTIPDFDFYAKTPPGNRPKLSPDFFADEYGAHPNEIKKVVQFLEEHGAKIVESHAGRRTVKAIGTVAQMNKAFAISLAIYEYTIVRHKISTKLTHRGFEGFTHLPSELAPLIIGVFGLDNRKIGGHSSEPGDPTLTHPLLIKQVTELYNFPTPGAAINQQTIGIIAPTGGLGGYFTSDLTQYFQSIGMALPPNIYPISIDGVNNASFTATTTADTPAGSTTLTFASTAGWSEGSPGLLVADNLVYTFFIQTVPSSTTIVVEKITQINTGASTFPYVQAGTLVWLNVDQETTQDICIVGSIAQGANIAVYFTDDSEPGWIDMISSAIHPDAGDFPIGVNPPSVLSASWWVAAGDDPRALSEGPTASMLFAMHQAFQDAAIHGITVCISSGDLGAAGAYLDGLAHTIYPSSDPWVLSVGGTTIGKFEWPSFWDHQGYLQWVEYCWNDYFIVGEIPLNTVTGGGVSDFFPLPSYQQYAGVPENVNGLTFPKAGFNQTGRGVPDVAANASVNSGYPITLAGLSQTANGTSASAPLWASLITILNANLGYHLGFINPMLYQLANVAFNPITPLWPDPANTALLPCPKNNSYTLFGGTVTGYPAKKGWDACTGLGSPNGNALLAAFKNLAPDVYVLGGFQSPSILIEDPALTPPNNQVPVTGLGTDGITFLKPDYAYNLAAVVVNDSSVVASSVEVRFWSFPGGLGLEGDLIGVPQIVSIPAFSSVMVNASAPYVSSPPGDHSCIAVTLFSPTTGCMNQALNYLEVPAPGAEGTHGCVAFRNTDILIAFKWPHRFSFPVSFGRNIHHLSQPILVSIETTIIPYNWQQLAAVTEVEDTLSFLGVNTQIPLCTIPLIKRNFSTIDLRPSLSSKSGNKIERINEKNYWKVHLHPHEETAINIGAEIPSYAHEGDIFVIKVSAQYPDNDSFKARTVEFYEYVNVTSPKSSSLP